VPTGSWDIGPCSSSKLLRFEQIMLHVTKNLVLSMLLMVVFSRYCNVIVVDNGELLLSRVCWFTRQWCWTSLFFIFFVGTIFQIMLQFIIVSNVIYASPIVSVNVV